MLSKIYTKLKTKQTTISITLATEMASKRQICLDTWHAHCFQILKKESQMLLAEKTEWLVSPITQKTEGLRSPALVELRAFYGGKKKLNLRHTFYTIGRDPSNDIVIDDPYVSLKHAELKLDSNGIYHVYNRNVRNRTYLNGVEISCAILPRSGKRWSN